MHVRIEKVAFPNGAGEMLDARLDLPIGPATAFALFAHCFTCTKDVLAAARIAEELARRGIAVLRFDFTGLGGSQGLFADTNFSSNVADLVAAAAYLREHHKAPELLIGHSLGGAAVLVAAHAIPEAKAVATIGAPANADHIEHQLGALVARIEEQGEADVLLAGRPFLVRKQFLEDVRGQKVLDAVAHLKRALLVMHAPLDQVVGVDNSTALFGAAKHPKSFVGLDGADHLLSNKSDARFAAASIATCAERYIVSAAPLQPVDRGEGVHVEETGYGLLQNRVQMHGETWLADEPALHNGDDTGPAPFAWVAAGLGACTSMTMRLYAQRKEMAVAKIAVDVDHAREPAVDHSRVSMAGDGSIDVFTRRIAIFGEVSDDDRARLFNIAERCPVHRLLAPGAVIISELLPRLD